MVYGVLKRVFDDRSWDDHRNFCYGTCDNLTFKKIAHLQTSYLVSMGKLQYLTLGIFEILGQNEKTI